MTDQNNQNNDIKLYAGKFKTVEELETGYKNSAVVFDENQNLKKKLEEVTSVPDNYLNPSDVELDTNRLTELQTRAKETGMTQAQYEKLVRGDKQRVDQQKQNFDKARKDVGEETLNILQDYVKKHYPPELADTMLNTFIQSKEARTAALNHRQQLLNNTVPGIGKTPALGNYHVSDEDIKKAYDQKEKTKSMKDINRYINLVNLRASQKEAS